MEDKKTSLIKGFVVFGVIDEIFADQALKRGPIFNQDIHVGVYEEDGSEVVACTVSFPDIGMEKHKSAAKVDLFQDNWRVFEEIPDFFTALSKYHDSYPSQQDIVLLLLELGYKDFTRMVFPECERRRIEKKYKYAYLPASIQTEMPVGLPDAPRKD